MRINDTPAGESWQGYFHARKQDEPMQIKCDKCDAVAEYLTAIVVALSSFFLFPDNDHPPDLLQI